jgi:hypothetical protein
MQTKTELIQFTKEEIDGIWNLVKNLIRKACIRAGGFVNEEHIKEYCKQGEMQLWVVITETNEVLCVCVTEIRKYPNYSVCDTKIVTGKRYKEWFDYVDKISEWAKEQGCKKMEIFSRPGYVSMFKEKGYSATHVQVEKEL